MGSRRKGDWSELCPELLTLIIGRLQTRGDFNHFRSVCTNWRSSTHRSISFLPILSPILPHKIPHCPHNLTYYGDLTIVANTTFLIQNSNPNFPKPWLVTLEEFTSLHLIVRKPLVLNAVKEGLPCCLALSPLRIRKIRKDYNFRTNVAGISIPIDYKVLLFYDHGCGDPTSVYDCYALVLDNQRKLLFLRLKDDWGSEYLRYGRVSYFDDIVCYKGAVWTIDRKGRAYIIPYHSKDLSLMRFTDIGVCGGNIGEMRKRLIESDDGLYMIHRYLHDSELKFSVYKLNEEEHKWCDVKNLDGRILFVSSDFCFFDSVEDYPGYVGNCILFRKEHFPVYKNPQSTYCPSSFSLEGADKVLKIEIFHMEDGKTGLITSYPGLSEIFWPPPCWIFSDKCPFARDVEESESEISCASNDVQIEEQVSNFKEDL